MCARAREKDTAAAARTANPGTPGCGRAFGVHHLIWHTAPRWRSPMSCHARKEEHMPSLPPVQSGWPRLALVACARTFALFVIACAFAYAMHAAIPIVFADGWWLSDTFVRRYLDGHLELADFFRKRAVGFDHAQPVHRLILLANVVWFDMDFMVEALIGALFGLAFLLLIAALVARDLRNAPGTLATRELVFVGLTVSVFSFNERELFTFSLATLAFVYLLGITLYFIALRHCMVRGRPILLFVATLACCVLLDTSAVLATASGCLLVVFIAFRQRRLAAAARCVLAIVAGLLLYRIGYALLLPMPDTVPADMLARIGRLLGNLGEAWKVLVIPTGDALISTSRVAVQHGDQWVWRIAIPCALLMLIGHVWFWRRFAPHCDQRLPFVAAGLMLYFYAVVVGIVWTRVADNGFDYLAQPRYLVFYSLQIIAMLMMWAFLAGHAATHEVSTTRPRTAMLGCAVAGLVMLALYFMSCVRYEMPYLRRYELEMARLIVDFGRDPKSPQAACATVRVEICEWSPERRNSVIEVLQRGRLNVFSDAFLKRHHWGRKLAAESP
jgi:hypothetical protein